MATLYTSAPTIDSQGEQTNPTSGTVMADTGALSAGYYEVFVTASATVDSQWQLQRRNSTNTGNTGDVTVFYTGISLVGQLLYVYYVDDNERLRLVMDGSITGVAVGCLHVTRIQ